MSLNVVRFNRLADMVAYRRALGQIYTKAIAPGRYYERDVGDIVRDNAPYTLKTEATAMLDAEQRKINLYLYNLEGSDTHLVGHQFLALSKITSCNQNMHATVLALCGTSIPHIDLFTTHTLHG